ncbi:MAG: DUF72 domain-containing protein [Candidatus Nezhaarchaeales archaeon]
MPHSLLLGTSGWSYVDWVGVFYETDKYMLRQYSEVFNTVEIDSTFYSYPSSSVVKAWVRSTPKSFIFSAKVPKLITHEKELDVKLGVIDDLRRFISLLSPLREAGKMGPLLFQLPPSLRLDIERLEKLLAELPEGHSFSIEFRDPSWLNEEVFGLLERFKVAYVIVDEPLLPPLIRVTAPFAYVRWHGKGKRPWYNYYYGLDELRSWVPKLNEALSKVEALYGYFNNHFHGYAVTNCLQMLKLMGRLTARQAQLLSKAEGFLAGRRAVPPPIAAAKEGMETYFALSSDDPTKLLELFMDRRRFERAREIPDGEVHIEEAGPRLLRARVKEYTVILDSESKEVLHDCADWSRVAAAKQLCKHVGKLFMRLPRQLAVRLLRQLYEERDEWTFRPLTGEAEL